MAVLRAAAFLGATPYLLKRTPDRVDATAIAFALLLGGALLLRRRWQLGVYITDGTFSYTFDEAGVYEYVCSLHSNVRGTVFVQNA
jgi:plastocyanin